MRGGALRTRDLPPIFGGKFSAPCVSSCLELGQVSRDVGAAFARLQPGMGIKPQLGQERKKALFWGSLCLSFCRLHQKKGGRGWRRVPQTLGRFGPRHLWNAPPRPEVKHGAIGLLVTYGFLSYPMVVQWMVLSFQIRCAQNGGDSMVVEWK